MIFASPLASSKTGISSVQAVVATVLDKSQSSAKTNNKTLPAAPPAAAAVVVVATSTVPRSVVASVAAGYLSSPKSPLPRPILKRPTTLSSSSSATAKPQPASCGAATVSSSDAASLVATTPPNAGVHSTRRRQAGNISFGQNLEHVVHFHKESTSSSIKKLTQYARQDTGEVSFSTLSKALAVREMWLLEKHNLPACPSFGNNQLVLDSVKVDNDKILVGNVLVRNLAFEKTVAVHYTIDNWATTHDILASFLNVVTPPVGNIKGMDKFVFKIDLNREFGAQANAANLAFALRYDVCGQQYWDNNSGANYRVNLVRPTADYKPPKRVHVTHPLFGWKDPAIDDRANSKPVKPATRPVPAAVVVLPQPSRPRAIPNVIAPSYDMPDARQPPRAPPSVVQAQQSSSPLSLPLSPEQRRYMRSSTLARQSPLAMPWHQWSPPPSPFATTPSSAPPQPASSTTSNANAATTNTLYRSPSPTSFSHTIEVPFSAGSLHIGRRSAFMSASPAVGGRSIADNTDAYISAFGCSPPGTPKNEMVTNASCRC
ncbi:putative phosphatase regulatory subunit-domain-containing protein [Geranomyces variabilis]|nr:putative phosphatase regulatory subunit-domain-containing protein [Geranomyces variabilis]KAJ3141888.1 hypothetical protein HDU90_006237 [Geranomyces variabilis]